MNATQTVMDRPGTKGWGCCEMTKQHPGKSLAFARRYPLSAGDRR
jgi:hypothetical protein